MRRDGKFSTRSGHSHEFTAVYPDVADLLADVCCYKQLHLPTGSTLSGRAAFFASRLMFDSINDLAEKSGNRMSLYVDDVTMSGDTATKRLMAEVGRTVRRHGHKTKQSKTKTFPAGAAKTVTGTVVYGDALLLPNGRHKKIWQARLAIPRASSEDRLALLSSLSGRLQDARQVLNANCTQNVFATGMVSRIGHVTARGGVTKTA